MTIEASVSREALAAAERMLKGSAKVSNLAEGMAKDARKPLIEYADRLTLAARNLQHGGSVEGAVFDTRKLYGRWTDWPFFDTLANIRTALFGHREGLSHDVTGLTPMREALQRQAERPAVATGLAPDKVAQALAEMKDLPPERLVPRFQALVDQTQTPDALRALMKGVDALDNHIHDLESLDVNDDYLTGPLQDEFRSLVDQAKLRQAQVLPRTTPANVERHVAVAQSAMTPEGKEAIYKLLDGRTHDQNVRKLIVKARTPSFERIRMKNGFPQTNSADTW
ncbi:MAG: hypothetical protein JWM80_5265 [Cyanobacteria bacterium RYN_339]|nr:hypothetical protein [Cyanobacteria bacterium RYN_339]